MVGASCCRETDSAGDCQRKNGRLDIRLTGRGDRKVGADSQLFRPADVGVGVAENCVARVRAAAAECRGAVFR